MNFAIASRYATAVTLLIFLPGTPEPLLEVPLDVRFHRTGEVWHAFLKGLEPGIQYAYRMDRVPNPQPQVHRFDPHQELLDPHAKALTGGDAWGVPPRGRRSPRRGLVVHDAFDWGDEEPYRFRPVDWRLLDTNADLFRFFKLLIGLRRTHPLLRREDFDLDEERPALHTAWHGVDIGKPDWSWESRSLAMHLYDSGGGEAEDIYFIANAHWEAHAFELPHLSERRWCRVIDTMQMPPHDIAETGAEEVLADQWRYVVGPRSVVVLIGKRCRPS